MHTLSTPRLWLEPLRAAHAGPMFELLGDPALYEYENAPPRSLEALRERYRRLETRRSPDGRQQWLNWVLRLHTAPQRPLIGYVQATLEPGRSTAIAYELASAHWHQGLGSEAVSAMLAALADVYAVRDLHAVLKRRNERSLRLLQRLHFRPPDAVQAAAHALDADELLMVRTAASRPAND